MSEKASHQPKMAMPAGLFVLLAVIFVLSGCGPATPELAMEVSTRGTARVGENAVVRLLLRNLPQEGSVIDMVWQGFAVKGEFVEAKFELPSLTGASDDQKELRLLWRSSNAGILGGQMAPPSVYSPNGEDLPPGSRDVTLDFFFEALSVGTTELALALTKPDGSTMERTVEVTVME